jgi:hypothetical protein
LIKKLLIIICLNLFFAIGLYCQDQKEIIRGVTINSGTGKKVAYVKIYPDFKNDTVYSGPSGKFKIRISSYFRDNIYFEHPGYYSYIHRITKGNNLDLQSIELYPNSLAIDTIFNPTLTGNRQIEGKVLAADTRLPIINAAISLEDHKRIVYSNNNGIYKVYIPNNTDKLIVSYKNYYSFFAEVPKDTMANPKDILMEPLIQIVQKDSGFYAKNSVRLMNGFMRGAVGIDYERFLMQKHSIGLKSYFYLYKGIQYVEMIPLSSNERATFTGIKLSPYYRNYLWRNESNGGFIEGMISYGYFDFEEINYFQDSNHDPDDSKFFSETSNCLGFGGSFGWMILFPNSPLVLNLSFGLQYFPLNVPKTKQVKMDAWYTMSYEVDDLFWYLGGPGSYLEIKFMIGGIF